MVGSTSTRVRGLQVAGITEEYAPLDIIKKRGRQHKTTSIKTDGDSIIYDDTSYISLQTAKRHKQNIGFDTPSRTAIKRAISHVILNFYILRLHTTAAFAVYLSKVHWKVPAIPSSHTFQLYNISIVFFTATSASAVKPPHARTAKTSQCTSATSLPKPPRPLPPPPAQCLSAVSESWKRVPLPCTRDLLCYAGYSSLSTPVYTNTVPVVPSAPRPLSKTRRDPLHTANRSLSDVPVAPVPCVATRCPVPLAPDVPFPRSWRRLSVTPSLACRRKNTHIDRPKQSRKRGLFRSHMGGIRIVYMVVSPSFDSRVVSKKQSCVNRAPFLRDHTGVRSVPMRRRALVLAVLQIMVCEVRMKLR